MDQFKIVNYFLFLQIWPKMFIKMSLHIENIHYLLHKFSSNRK